MWRLEKDPHLSSTFANVTMLDRSPDFDALRPRMERATWAVPRLRQRVQPAPANLSAPTWVDDPDFDIDLHVRRIALPKPGTLRQLLDLATLIVADPFDRTRPLWQFVVVEGLRGGKAALIQKMHHTITDGEGGVQLSLQFLDFERDAPPPPPIDPRLAVDVAAAAAAARRPPSRSATCSPAASGSRSASPARCAICSPTRRAIPAASAAAATPCAASSAARRHRAGPLAAVDRALAAPPPRGRARAVPATPRTRPSGSAARSTRRSSPPPPTPPARYHIELGAPVESLRASMAISTRTSSSGTNAFSLGADARADRRDADRRALHGDPARPTRPAAAAAGRRSTRSPRSPRRCRPRSSPASPASRPRRSTSPRRTSRRSPVPMYVAGAQLLENYPVGPLGRRRVQPHPDVVHRQPRHGRQHRHRGGHRAGAAAPSSSTARSPTSSTPDGAGRAQTCSGSGQRRASSTTGRRGGRRRPRRRRRARGCIIWPSALSMTVRASWITASWVSVAGASSCSVIAVTVPVADR